MLSPMPPLELESQLVVWLCQGDYSFMSNLVEFVTQKPLVETCFHMENLNSPTQLACYCL